MHPADIHAALKKAGSSWTAVARSLRGKHNRPLTVAAVFNVVHGFSKSDKIAFRLSQVLQVPVADLFPGQYPRLEALQAKLVAAAGDMPILGPNCYGVINYLDGALLWPDQHGAMKLM